MWACSASGFKPSTNRSIGRSWRLRPASGPPGSVVMWGAPSSACRGRGPSTGVVDPDPAIALVGLDERRVQVTGGGASLIAFIMKALTLENSSPVPLHRRPDRPASALRGGPPARRAGRPPSAPAPSYPRAEIRAAALLEREASIGVGAEGQSHRAARRWGRSGRGRRPNYGRARREVQPVGGLATDPSAEADPAFPMGAWGGNR